MIRVATEADIDPLLVMSRHFVQFAPHARMMGATDESMTKAIRFVLDQGQIFLAEVDGKIVGMLMAVIFPIWFVPQSRCAMELVWWVEPEHRGGTIAIRMVKAFEEWGRMQGATMATMGDFVVDGQPPVGDMIMRMGYMPSERAFVKGI